MTGINKAQNIKHAENTKAAPENKEQPDEQFVIPDECGDTLWDAVLKQEEAKENRLKNEDEQN